MSLDTAQENAFQGLNMLLRLSQVRVTGSTLRKNLLQHPDFPSLASLSETLDELRVENMAVRLTPAQLSEVPLPALVYLNSEGGFFAPMRLIAADAVEWWHNERGWQKETIAQFATRWNGITLLIEKDEEVSEAHYAESKRRQRLEKLRVPFAIASGLVCLLVWTGLLQPTSPGFGSYFFLLALQIVGVVACSRFIWHDLKESVVSSRMPNRLNAGFQLAAPTLFGWVNWAELCLFYFGGSLLALLFFRTQATALYPILFGLANGLLAGLFWVLYARWHRVRQWYSPCFWIIGIVLLQLALLISFPLALYWQEVFAGSSVLLLITAYLALPSLWVLAKPVLLHSVATNGLQQSMQEMKFDPEYLTLLAGRARPLPPVFTGMEVPVLGNPDASHTLTIVINPVCTRCAQAYLEVELLLADVTNVRGLIIVAAVASPAHALSHLGPNLAQFILSQPTSQMPGLLHEWYTASQPRNWFERIKLKEISAAGKQQLSLHLSWCELAGVDTTPTICFNGIEIPTHYTMPEIRKLILFLAEQE